MENENVTFSPRDSLILHRAEENTVSAGGGQLTTEAFYKCRSFEGKGAKF